MKPRRYVYTLLWLSILIFSPCISNAWNDETHLSIAKAAGYTKWYNATGADMAKIKAGKIEANNHYFNNPPGNMVTPSLIEKQIERYDTEDHDGHLYGAIVQAIRNYFEFEKRGKYGEYHLAFCAHYIGDLSMPLHNLPPTDFSKRTHKKTEESVNAIGLDKLCSKISIYPIQIDSEKSLLNEIARVANISIRLGEKLMAEDRLLTHDEWLVQLGHSASLFKAVLDYVRSNKDR